MTYSSYDSLKDHVLNIGDEVIFDNLTYKVNKTYLFYKSGFNNAIFVKLNIKDKLEFCSKFYGYKSPDGAWPEYRCCDYKAATRVCLELFKILESSKEDIKEDSKVIKPSINHEFEFTHVKPIKVHF